MPRKRYTAEQIIRYLRQAEVLTSQHKSDAYSRFWGFCKSRARFNKV